jgi:uncharacterized protein YndB with AHSA1/START domain
MTAQHRGSIVEFPSELEIQLTREFEAPIQLVFDVLTKEEHMVHTIAPYGEVVTKCSIDLRVGGEYHYIFLSDEGMEMSFRGTFLEVEPPTRSVQTWIYDGWVGVEAIESVNLSESGGVTTMVYRLAFPDEAARAHMGSTHGLEANFDNVDTYLKSLRT